MGSLSSYWSDKSVDLKSKYLVFAAIPRNLLLWGREIWDLRTSLLSKMEVFLHRSVRRILGITMTEVKEERIRNAEVRERFFNIPTIQNQIAKRQLTFIGKVVRNSDQQLPTKLLTAWCNQKQRRVGVIHLNKKYIVQNIALNLPCIGKTGIMSEWVQYGLSVKLVPHQTPDCMVKLNISSIHCPMHNVPTHSFFLFYQCREE